MSDKVIEQLLVQMNEFIIDEMGDDTHENLLLMLAQKEAQDEAGSSVRGERKKIYIERDRDEGNERLVADYFSRQPVFPPNLFRRRFRMNRELFIRIVNAKESLESDDLDLSKITKEKKKNESWSNGEEILLMSAWVTISTDSFTGNGQQGKDFWRRITEYYNEFRKSFSPRTQRKVKGHWYQIMPIINEFNQIFINVEKEYHSGWSDDQLKERVRQIYYSRYGKQFKYEHAWEIVKNEPKWSGGSMDDVHSKRTKTTSSGSYTSSSDVQTSINVEEDEPEFRPTGKAKASGKRKGKATTSNTEVNDSLRDLINETNSLRMARINEVNENIKDIKDSYKSSKRIEELKYLSQSTQGLNDEQLAYHNMLCSEIKEKYGI